MCIENHGQRLAGSLCMPENTAFAITTLLRCAPGALHRLTHGKILMICCQNLDRTKTTVIKTNKVFQQIKQTLFLEHPLEKDVVLSKLCIFLIPVLRLPCHKAVLTRGDRSRFGCEHVADSANAVINEHRRNFLHVVADLCISLGNICLFPRRRLKLDQNHRQTIQKHQHIRPLVTVLHKRPLVRHNKGVIIRILIIHDIDDVRAHFSLVVETHLHPVLQVVHKDCILLNQRPVLEVL